MKRILLLLVVSFPAFSQTTDVPTGVKVTPSVDVPPIVSERFGQVQRNTNASWSKTEGGDYRAVFTSDSTGQPGEALYSSTGELLRLRTRLEKGGYPEAVDQYYFIHYPTSGYEVWKQAQRDYPPQFLAIKGTDTLWFGEQGNYMHEKNRQMAQSALIERDRAFLLDISIANSERISMLSHVGDSSKVISKTLLAGHYGQIDGLVRRLGATKNVPLPEPMLPVGKIREPSVKDFSRLDKRFLKLLQKTAKKAVDKDLKSMAQHLIGLEKQLSRHGGGVR